MTVLAFLSACAAIAPKFEKPNLSVANIEMLNGNLVQQNFRVTFKIQNPNDRALPVNGLHAQLKVNGESIASGVSNHAFVVPALGESEFDMNISANMALALLKFANQSNGQMNGVDYDLVGSVSINLPFLRDLPFAEHGSFALDGAAH